MGEDLSTCEAGQLFMERFPSLGLMIGSYEAREMPLESPPFFAWGKEDVFYFYGLCPEVYVQRKGWLTGEKQLVFLEDDPGRIISFLQQKEALAILSDLRVHIELVAHLDQLVHRFPVKRVEIGGLKSKKGLKKLKLELLRKTALAHALYMDRLHGYQPFSNFIQNLKQLPRSFYANRLFGAFEEVPAVICGAGPSLESTLQTLRGLENKALLIAGGSTLAALSSKGIMPHFGMAIDPNLEEYRRLKNSFAFEVPLLFSTRVHPDIFRTCNGPFGYMRSGIGGLLELWIEEELGIMDPLLAESLSSETISVTGVCVAFAQALGCNPILLNGIDMAYTGGVRYASGVDHHQDSALELIDQEKSAPDRIIRKKGTYSAVRWIMESAGISDFVKRHKKTKFVNTTAGGIGFQGIRYTPIEEAVADFKEQNLRERVFEKIFAAKMPKDVGEKMAECMEELKASLARVIQYLQILSEEKKGVKALAEMELEEEIANIYLFYDVRQLLKPDALFWKNFLQLARRYDKACKPK